jgi:type IV secretion system protein TrbL
MKKLTAGRLVVLLVLLSVLPLAAHAAPAVSTQGTYLDKITNDFSNATATWMNISQGYAKHIFLMLAALEISWAGVVLVLKKGDLADFVAAVALKVSAVAFFFSIIVMAPTWVPLIMSSFQKMGGSYASSIPGAGGATFTPNGVMQQGIDVVTALWNWFGEADFGSGLTFVGHYIEFALVLGATSAFTVIGFALLALQFMMTLIESYIILGMSVVFLGFLGSHWTSSWGEKTFGYAVSVGVKMMVILAMAGLGAQLDHNLVTSLNAAAASKASIPPGQLFGIGATNLIFGLLGLMAPGMASSMLNGSPHMSLGNTAGAAVGAAAMAAAPVALAGAAGAAAVGGLNKMAGLVGAAAGGGASGAGGAIAGTERLATLGQMTGSGGGKPAGGMMGSIGGGAKGGGASTSAPTSGTPAGSLAGAGSVGANTARMGQAAQAMMEGKGISGPSSTPLRPSATPAPAQPSPAPSAPPTGPVDALGAPSGESGAAATSAESDKDSKSAAGQLWDIAKNSAQTAHDQTQRQGDGHGGTVSIRFNHHEG